MSAMHSVPTRVITHLLCHRLCDVPNHDASDTQTSRCMCGIARVLRFQDGILWMGIVGEIVVWSGLDVTVQEQQG